MSSPLVRPTLTKFAERGSRDGTSPKESFGVDSSAATRNFFVVWSERFDAAKAILGFSQIGYVGDVVTNPPDGLRRIPPLQHPDNTNWRAAKISSMEGHEFTTSRVPSDTSIANQFKWARIQVEYENLGYYTYGDNVTTLPDVYPTITWPTDEYKRWVSFGEARTSTDYITLPGGTIKYCRSSGSAIPHNQSIPFNAGTVLPIIELPVMWHRVPYNVFNPAVPGPWMIRMWGLDGSRPYIGTVNKSAFWGFPAGMLLLLNVRPIPRKSDFQDLEWDIEFTIGIDPNKWNHKAYIPANGLMEWLTVLRTTGGVMTYYADGSIPDGLSIYNEREFINLFQVY